jgi:dTDP-4-dehydrorhamnose reductase
MRILILGADGMIGHKIAHSLGDFELILASRKTISSKSIGITNAKMMIHNLISDSLDSLLDKTFPDIIINCAGITTRRGVGDNIADTRLLNTELPYKLNSWVDLNSKKTYSF